MATPRNERLVNGINFRGFMAYSVMKLLTEKPRSREELIKKLWGLADYEDADKALRQLLARVRQQLEPHGLTVTYGVGVKQDKTPLKIIPIQRD